MFRGGFSNRLIDGLTMFIVTGASLMLLLYVGYSDSKRTYEQIISKRSRRMVSSCRAP